MNESSPIPDVSVLLTTWNSREMTLDAVRSIGQNTRGITYEILVVDDASSDGTAEALRSEFPDLRLIVSEQNLGFVRANNLGARHARGRHLLLLNTDTLLANNAVAILSHFLEDHVDVGVCGGLLLNRDMTPQVSYGDEPSFGQAFVDSLFLNDIFPGAGFPNRGTVPRLPCAGPIDVDYVTGAGLMIRRTIVESLGLFDELFREYCEETDLCRRVRTVLGLRVVFVPDATIIHFGGVSYGQFGEGQIRRHYLTYAKYLSKYHGSFYSFGTRLLYAWHYAVKMVVRLAAALMAHAPVRQQKLSMAKNAWYSVRYSLAPWGERP